MRVFRLSWSFLLPGGPRIVPDRRGLYRTEDEKVAERVARALGVRELTEEEAAELEEATEPSGRHGLTACVGCKGWTDLVDSAGFCPECVAARPGPPPLPAAGSIEATHKTLDISTEPDEPDELEDPVELEEPAIAEPDDEPAAELPPEPDEEDELPSSAALPNLTRAELGELVVRLGGKKPRARAKHAELVALARGLLEEATR